MKKTKKKAVKSKKMSTKKGIKAAAMYVVALALSILVIGNVVKAQVGGNFLDLLAEKVSNQLLSGTQNTQNGETMVGASNRAIQYVYDYANGIYVSGSQIFDSSANTTLPGTLAVTGASTFTGAATFNGNVTGIATSTLTTLNVSATTTVNN